MNRKRPLLTALFFTSALACCSSISAYATSAATDADKQMEVKSLDTAQIKQLVANQFDTFIKDLKTLTNIDSGTGNKEGNAKIVSFLKQRIEELGGTVELKETDAGAHVIGHFKGNGKLRVLISVHTDTVFEKGEAAKRPFSIDSNNHAHGPGAADDKVSVAEALQIMEVFKKIDIKNYGEIILHCDAEEEVGGSGEEAIIKELLPKTNIAIVIDGSQVESWDIVSKRKGIARYLIKVTGISGHAGATPHTAASATMELGNQLSMLRKLVNPPTKDPKAYSAEILRAKGIVDRGQFIPENTLNVGVIGTSNTKINIIPDNAFAKVEVRSFRQSELDRLEKEIHNLANKAVVPGTKVEVTTLSHKEPMEKSAQTEKLLKAYKDIVQREYKTKVTELAEGGATVGNEIAQYVPTLDSPGVTTAFEHTEKEYADLNTFVPRTVSLIMLIDELGRKNTFVSTKITE